MLRHRDLADILCTMADRERDRQTCRDLYDAASRLYDLADEEDRVARDALRGDPEGYDCFACWRADPANASKLPPPFWCPLCRSDICMRGTAHVNECAGRLT